MSRPPRHHTFVLSRNAFGKLVFTASDGIVHEGVVPVLAFAISAPEGGIALLSVEGKELQWIDRLAELPDNERQLVTEELAQRDFMPEIHRIVAVSSFATPSTWQVETDRGPTTLILKSEDDIRRLRTAMGPGALLIADSQGIHFLIRDRATLDGQSQKFLKRFL